MIVPNDAMKALESAVSRGSVFAAAGYKYKWGYSKTKTDVCPCSICGEKQPAGTRMAVLRSAYHGQILAAVCPTCSRQTKADKQ